MPARKHNMVAAKWIGIILGGVSLVATILTIDWGNVVKAGTSAIFVYENVDSLRHVLEAHHDILAIEAEVKSTRAQLDSIKKVLFITSNRDSLIHIIELMNRGKLPYDSIWRKSESGHWYLTTVKNHFENEHHD